MVVSSLIMKPRIKNSLLIGAVLGFLYGLVTQTINMFALPGVPLAQTSHILTNILVATIGGASLGLITAWPDETLTGIISGSLAAGILITANAVYQAEFQFWALLILFLFTFLPLVVIYMPLAALIRYLVLGWEEKNELQIFTLRRKMIMLALITGLPILMGAFSLFSKEDRAAIQSMNNLIQTGMQATAVEELPRPLQPVRGFVRYAQGSYTLEVISDPDIIPVSRPPASMDVTETAILVRYKNGFRFGCVFTPLSANPICSDF
jgi:hypothetical protein